MQTGTGEVCSGQSTGIGSPGNNVELFEFPFCRSNLPSGTGRSDSPVKRSQLSSFQKMTGKTITAYLEEYRVNKSFPLVQSGQYSMVQIAEMTGFSNPSRFADAFRRRVGCNPGDYSRNRKITNDKIQNILNI